MEAGSPMNQEIPRVLVVDDNQDIRDLVVHFLSADGFHVFSASSGDEALAILKSNTVNLVLLDVMMPGKSGLEVLAEIRGNSQRTIRDLPVMMITAKSSTDDIDIALATGANSYVVKPFRAITIREKVRSILELPTTNA
jgi:two-component system phosphate regulon response regulator PhoB